MDRSALKEKEGDNCDNAKLWDEHNFDVREMEGAECGNDERDEGDGGNDDEESEEEEEECKGDGSRM